MTFKFYAGLNMPTFGPAGDVPVVYNANGEPMLLPAPVGTLETPNAPISLDPAAVEYAARLNAGQAAPAGVGRVPMVAPPVGEPPASIALRPEIKSRIIPSGEGQLESRGLNQEEVVAAGLPPGQYIGKFKGGKIVSIDPVPQEPDNIASAREKALDAPNLGYLDVAAASAKKLAPLNAALDLLNSKSVETGTFANYRTEARKLFGQDVSNEEQFNSLVGTLAMEALDLTKGSISNMEQKYFTEVLAPNISKSVDGNKKILEFRIGLAKRDVEIGEKVREMFEKKATPIEIQREVSKIVEKNPLDKPMSSRASATGVGLDKEAIDALDFLNIPPAQ